LEESLRFLAPGRRFERDLRRHLLACRTPPEAIEVALARVRELGLLDDEETSRAWIRDRMKLAPRGAELMRRELLSRGVAEPVAEGALRELATEEAIVESAVRMLERGRARYARCDLAVARRRMWGVLARRGFSREASREAIRRYFDARKTDS
jgi:regulatory protein